MSDAHPPESDFLNELNAVLEQHLANEQFGVSELADAMNMSRSNLLRKVKKETKLSVSQLISQVRLKRAMELLRKTSLNVSEVSHQVGFNSTSYFIKCFREYYGYPPGEVGKRDNNTAPAETGKLPDTTQQPKPALRRNIIMAIAAIVAVALAAYFLWPGIVKPNASPEKSIAVLPFKNESADSTNVYLINGLMEATLNNLQQIQDLRVISRTTAEKYRNTTKSIPELARELHAGYFVEGSGQKIGDRIVLNIQLIDAATDTHLWAKQYRRESKDIFELQEEIARNIAEEIEVIVTPEEKSRIEKKPTDDLQAYDDYLKGRDLFYRSGPDDLRASIPFFKKAIERDPQFALAYATAAMVYYYLDIFQLEKQYSADIENFADKAILYDPNSAESLVAKALSFAQRHQYDLAIPYLERALEYAPHSGLVLHFLTEFYAIHVPNPTKYLEYAIKKAQVDKVADSATASFNYFHVSNALLQTGFFEEASRYNTRSLQLDPKNFFAGFVKAYIYYAMNKDCQKTKEMLMQEWEKNKMRFDILQEVGKVDFLARDYAGARSCYDRAIPMMRQFGLDIFRHEYLRIGATYVITGEKEKGEDYIRQYKAYADENQTPYKDLFLTGYYGYRGDTDKAMTLFKKFAREQDNIIYWIMLMRDDPLSDNLKKHPEFDAVMREVEQKFWNKHKALEEQWGAAIKNL